MMVLTQDAAADDDDGTYRITHNTYKFTFVAPGGTSHDESTGLNLPVASCLVVRADIDGKPVVRPYTPVSSPNESHIDLIVKNYEQGVMSKHIHNLKIGDKLEMKGPISKIPITKNMKREIGMIAGGTGITPMYQVIEHVLQTEGDNTKLSLLFANVSPDDILLKKELDGLAQKYPDRFKVAYTVDRVPEGENWDGHVGFTNKELVNQYMPKPESPEDESILVMVCGPPGMMKHVSGEKTKDFKQGELTGLLKECGYSEKNVFKF